MKETLVFLIDLKNNNNREWFVNHRDRYERMRDFTREFTANMIEAVGRVEPQALLLRHSDCTYRINRDIRFSPDKSPYKTHIGVFINPHGGKKSVASGYYFHIEPGNCLFAAGNIGHPPKVLAAIRKSIVDNVEEYHEMMTDTSFRNVFPIIGENLLKTTPKGFDRNWEYAPYLRPRNYVAYTRAENTPERWITDPDYLQNIIAQAYRFNRFINFAVAEALGVDPDEL